MTPTQREAALRLVDWLHASGVVNSEVKETIALLRDLLAEPRGEPAGWIQPDHLQKARVAPFLCRVEPTKRMSDFVPLYAHPPQQRKPLTKVQITELAEQCGYDGAVPTVRLAFQGFKLDDFARAIERAVTGEQK